jgi:hypothetical protein
MFGKEVSQIYNTRNLSPALVTENGHRERIAIPDSLGGSAI